MCCYFWMVYTCHITLWHSSKIDVIVFIQNIYFLNVNFLMEFLTGFVRFAFIVKKQEKMTKVDSKEIWACAAFMSTIAQCVIQPVKVMQTTYSLCLPCTLCTNVKYHLTWTNAYLFIYFWCFTSFKASLNKLMETLGQSEPYFVKCIRSNAEKVC